MNEADLEYLRNINTRPGPNAGRSIDPTKPGPDAAIAQSDAKPALPQTLRDAAENLLIAIGMGWDLNGCAENLRAALAQSDAEPECKRALKHAKGYIESSIFNVPSKEKTDEILSEIDTTLASDAEPGAWREALEQQLSDLVELARDARSDRGGATQWTHPIGALVSEFVKRIAAPPRPDASAGQNIQRYMRDDIDGDTRTPEQKQPGPKYVPIGGAGNGA